MNVAIGFGSNEENFEQLQYDMIDELLKEYRKNLVDDFFFFDENVLSDLKFMLEQNKIKYDELYEKYKNESEFPERYSYFTYRILNNYLDLCVIMQFGHINRKHPFSPDGWALLKTKKVYHFHSSDY
jgi:hypothetical protein